MNGMEGRPSSCLLVRGRPPLLARTQAVVQAIDPAQFIKPSRFVPVRSTASGPVASLAFRCGLMWSGTEGSTVARQHSCPLATG